MRAKLVVVGGDTKTPEIELHLPAVLGRGREATLTLPHPLVSRQHCEIYETNGQLMVRDLGSLNGTFVANERVNEAVLDNGQLLTVGTVTFRAIYLGDDGAVDEAVPQDEALPLNNEKTLPVPATPAPMTEATPPMATPIPAEEPNAAEEDDDLSSFFDSLQ